MDDNETKPSSDGVPTELTEGHRQIIQQQRMRNQQALQRLDTLGYAPSDVESGIDRHNLRWIIINLLTPEEKERMEVAWEIEYGRILNELEGRVREAIAAQQRGKLITPPSTPRIVVPGHPRRSRS